jgi:hypothetical protein
MVSEGTGFARVNRFSSRGEWCSLCVHQRTEIHLHETAKLIELHQKRALRSKELQ